MSRPGLQTNDRRAQAAATKRSDCPGVARGCPACVSRLQRLSFGHGDRRSRGPPSLLWGRRDSVAARMSHLRRLPAILAATVLLAAPVRCAQADGPAVSALNGKLSSEGGVAGTD